MSNEIAQFINHWLYDVDRFLRDRLDAIKDDLASDDEDVCRKATEEADLILDWLYPSLSALSSIERLEKATKIFRDQKLSSEDKEASIDRIMRSTGRRRGRPRDEISQIAIRALGLHLATGMSWRAISMMLRGCDHERSMPPRQNPRNRNPALACEDCGESLRIAVYRLRKFLKGIGFQEDVPLGKELDEESRLELIRLWVSEQ